jgi:tryptophanyl-tRNA synthetase
MTPKSASKRVRVVSGMRPTGKLHLGHYHGVLKNWIRLQEEYECFFFVADWHGLTTEYAKPEVVRDSTREILIDWLSAGLEPEKAVVFIQSQVKEHAELHLILSMLAPLGWLERVPSYKEMQQELSNKDLSTYGFLGYPLLQTADIALYDGKKVPVGVDQVPHIELAREIVRRFNYLYGETLVEPQPLLTEAPKLLGPDRRKMSKSYDNCLYLSDPPEAIEKKILSAITDPGRIRRDDPGNPDICLIYDYHKLHSPPAEIARVARDCRAATLGCVEDKKKMAVVVNDFLEPIRQRRKEFLKDPRRIDEIVRNGSLKAAEIASQTLDRVKKAMKLL